MTGTDISSWVTLDELLNPSFSFDNLMEYRTSKTSKAVPGFDVIDYGQEDYVFSNEDVNARHRNTYLLKIYEEYRDVLEPLFNEG
ncbi:MAG: hypothetical protein ACK5LV_04085 [Lachnospirales bacterium]